MRKVIEKECLAFNLLNIEAEAIAAVYLPILQPLIGKKIFLVDGSKAKILKYDYPNDHKRQDLCPAGYSVQIARMCDGYTVYKDGQERGVKTLDIDISLCINNADNLVGGGSTCFYVKKSIRIGTLAIDGQTLLEVFPLSEVVKANDLSKRATIETEMAIHDELTDLWKKAKQTWGRSCFYDVHKKFFKNQY